MNTVRNRDFEKLKIVIKSGIDLFFMDNQEM